MEAGSSKGRSEKHMRPRVLSFASSLLPGKLCALELRRM